MKTLIFDFDGVFVDSFRVSLEAFQALHKKYKIVPISEHDLKKLFCGNLWEAHKKKYELDKEKEEAFKKEILTYVTKRQDEITFFKGIQEVMKELADLKHSLCIISSNKSSAITKKLATLNLENAFIKILGADLPGNKEEKMKEILKEKGGNKEIFFVTDTVGDLKEVENLPIKTIAVSWGFHSRKDLEKEKPHYIIETPEELLKIV